MLVESHHLLCSYITIQISNWPSVVNGFASVVKVMLTIPSTASILGPVVSPNCCPSISTKSFSSKLNLTESIVASRVRKKVHVPPKL